MCKCGNYCCSWMMEFCIFRGFLVLHFADFLSEITINIPFRDNAVIMLLLLLVGVAARGVGGFTLAPPLPLFPPTNGHREDVKTITFFLLRLLLQGREGVHHQILLVLKEKNLNLNSL